MSTHLYTHRACLRHDPGHGHVECPARLSAVLEALAAPEFATLKRVDAPLAGINDLERAHPREYVKQILASEPASGVIQLDADTYFSPGSVEAALRAAGAVSAAVDAVMRNEARNAFCAVRPPGHHAKPERAMGFCVFNNVVVGALRAQAVHNAERVAVVDFDVHHGNGTQDAAEKNAKLFYASTHQWPLYPGTGRASETGLDHNVVNVPLSRGMGGDDIRRAFNEKIFPAMSAFKPELVMISAGFDAHKDDPLGGLKLDEADFAWLTEQICAFATKHCAGKVVSVLEGGYNLAALGRSAAAHVKALMAS